ncbi:LPD38 domain-containing protein [Desulfobaculum sp. SPO524]|uniref:LPD38 domain-containing protein n=1 Tax=Desulfobaculum sp. SPO524 TaxID=3378071 RepID=UPI003851CC00
MRGKAYRDQPQKPADASFSPAIDAITPQFQRYIDKYAPKEPPPPEPGDTFLGTLGELLGVGRGPSITDEAVRGMTPEDPRIVAQRNAPDFSGRAVGIPGNPPTPPVDDLPGSVMSGMTGAKPTGPGLTDEEARRVDEMLVPIPDAILTRPQPGERRKREPETDFLGGLSVFGRSFARVPEETAAAMASAWRGGDIDHEEGAVDAFIRRVRQRGEDYAQRYGSGAEFLPGITVRDVAQFPRNLGFSLTSMGAGLGAGVPVALAPVPGARPGAWLAGTSASGAAAFRMAKDDIVSRYRDALQEQKAQEAKAAGKKAQPLTQEEWNAAREEFDAKAVEYGLWEALPEAIGSAVGLKLLITPLKRMIGKSLAARVLGKVGGVYGEELVSETITQKGQNPIEQAVDPRVPDISWLEALREVAPQTVLLTTVLGGGTWAGKAVFDAAERKLTGRKASRLVEDAAREGRLGELPDEVFEAIRNNVRELARQDPKDARLAGAARVLEREAALRTQRVRLRPELDDAEYPQGSGVDTSEKAGQNTAHAIIEEASDAAPDGALSPPQLEPPSSHHLSPSNEAPSSSTSAPVPPHAGADLVPSATPYESMKYSVLQKLVRERALTPATRKKADLVRALVADDAQNAAPNTAGEAEQGGEGLAPEPVTAEESLQPDAAPPAEPLSTEPEPSPAVSGKAEGESSAADLVGRRVSMAEGHTGTVISVSGDIARIKWDKGVATYTNPESWGVEDVRAALENEPSTPQQPDVAPEQDPRTLRSRELQDMSKDARAEVFRAHGLNPGEYGFYDGITAILDKEFGHDERIQGSQHAGLDHNDREGAGETAVSGEVAAGRRGAGVTIRHPGGQERAVYALVELEDVTASHLPQSGFQRNPAYPYENERPYHRDTGEQEKVLERAQADVFDPAFVVSEAVDAVHGPPVVDARGVVLGGNSRAMILERVYGDHPEAATAYRDALTARADLVGLSAEDVAAMKQPVLVRMLTDDVGPRKAPRLISTFNRDFKQAVDSRAEGVSAARFISPRTWQHIGSAMHDVDTLRQYFDSPHSRILVDQLIEDGALEKTQAGRLRAPDGRLNEEGKAHVERVLRGVVVDDYELVQRLPASIVKYVDRIIPSAARIMALGSDWNIIPQFRQALELFVDFRASTHDSLSAFLNTGSLMGEDNPAKQDRVVQALLYALRYMKPREFEAAWKSYAHHAGMALGEVQALPGLATSQSKAFRAFATPKTPKDVLPPAKPSAKPPAGPEKGKGAPPEQRAALGRTTAPRRPIPSGIATTPALEDPVRRSSIIAAMAKGLGIPIRVGGVRWPRAGVYKIRPQVVRLLQANDVEVAAHEIAHHIQEWQLMELPAVMPTEVQLLAYDGATDLDCEGFAEFVRLWITNEAVAREEAPGFCALFETNLAKQPDLQNLLAHVRQQWEAWMAQPDVAKVLSVIDHRGDRKRRWFPTFNDLYTQVVDELHPFKVLSDMAAKRRGAKLDPRKDPYLLAWALRGWVGKAEHFLKWGTFRMDADGYTVTGPSLREILLPVEQKGLRRLLDAYLVARRARADARVHSGFKNIIPQPVWGNAEAEIREAHPEVVQAAEELEAYCNSLLDLLVDSGRMSAESAAFIRKKNLFYTPLHRVMERETPASAGTSRRRFGGLFSPVKRLKGSSRDIIPPTESILKNTFAFMNVAERNRVGRALLELTLIEGLGVKIEAKPLHTKVNRVETREALRQLLDMLSMMRGKLGDYFDVVGELVEDVDAIDEVIKIVTAQDFLEEFGIEGVQKVLKERGLTFDDLEPLQKFFQTFRPDFHRTGPGEVIFYSKGRPYLVELDDEMYKAVQGLNPEAPSLLLRILALPASILRAGATLAPEFALRNPGRDTFEAFLNSEELHVPYYSMMKGLFHVMGRDDAYKRFYASGGAHGALVSLDRDYLSKNLDHLLADRTKQVKHLITHPIELLRAFSEATEEATRVADFDARTKRDASGRGHLEAGIAARDLTIDFSRGGAKTLAMNMLVAFWRATVGGTDRMVRAMRKNPKRYASRAFMGITLPSILLWLTQKDDPIYQELKAWRRILFWNVVVRPTGAKPYVVSLPKPHAPGILFGSFPEMVLDWMDKEDPEGLTEAGRALLESLWPGIMPTGLTPFVEWWAGRNWFFDRPTVPRGKEALEPVLQYSTHTPETLKLLARAMHRIPWLQEAANPAKMDNLVRSLTGGLGRLSLEGLDALLETAGVVEAPPAPKHGWQDLPGIRGMARRFPTTSTRSIEVFYKRYNQRKRTINSIKQRAGLRGTGARVELPPDLQAMDRAARALALLRRMARDIYADENATAEGKREALDAIFIQMINVARQGIGKPPIQESSHGTQNQTPNPPPQPRPWSPQSKTP